MSLKEILLSIIAFFTTIFSGPKTLTQTPNPTLMPHATQSAIYEITFESPWSNTTHPDTIPLNAHFSPFVVYSHNGTDSAQTYALGSIASPGVEDMAETGATAKLEKEITNIISQGNALEQSKAKKFNVPGKASVQIKVDNKNHQLSFVSMIAPSPDWFVATQNIELFSQGDWVENLTLSLENYDAGTDSGKDFTSPDADESSKKPISKLNYPILSNLGTLEVKRVK